LQNPNNASDHLIFSFQAIITGGLFGTGIGMSSLKFIGLPVAHTDSIFAVIAEETGLVGMFSLLLAYLVILWRGLSIARRAPDKLGRMLAAGITIWIVLEAFINIGVMVNLFPNAGNALPLISYGGSSLLTTMAGVGILLNIGRSADQKDVEGEQTFGAVVDLRWRNGRRRVSRSVGSAGTRK
jgi:cell division protein FtsW